MADEAYCIGGNNSSDSYLMINRIISAAEIGNVQAIHPGYGFLAENAHFAEVCRSCKIEFIGPPHAAMQQLGAKVTANLWRLSLVMFLSVVRLRLVHSPFYKWLRPLRPLETWLYLKLNAPPPRPADKPPK